MTKLIKKILYTGTITLKTGLHIGGTNTALNIGGPDKFVVRNPLNKKPYIPGSSLKGKLRSLLELKHGCIDVDRNGNSKASSNPNSPSGKLFGVAAKNNGHPSRLIVRDCEMIINEENKELFKNTDLHYTESKTEANIDRVTSAANPRTYERVPAGAQFELNMVLNVFDTDDEAELKRLLDQAIALLHDDYLGGSGSRGYGQVELKFKKEDGEPKTYID